MVGRVVGDAGARGLARSVRGECSGDRLAVGAIELDGTTAHEGDHRGDAKNARAKNAKNAVRHARDATPYCLSFSSQCERNVLVPMRSRGSLSVGDPEVGLSDAEEE